MTFPTRRTMSITLSANQELPVNISGSFIAIVSATADFQIQFDDQGWLDTGRGFGYPGGIDPETGQAAKFKGLRLKETAGASNTIQIVWGEGEVIDNRAIFGGEAVPTEEVSPDLFTSSAHLSAPDGATTQAFAADPNRLRAILTNVGTGTVFICDSGATSAEGIPLAAGESRELATAAAIYIRNDTGGAVNIARAEVKRS